MKRPSVLWGIGIAAVLSIGCFGIMLGASLVLSPADAVKSALYLATLSYLLLLYRRVAAQSGKVVLFLVSAAFLLAAGSIVSLTWFAMLCAGTLGLNRALLCYASFVAAGLDAALTALGFLFAGALMLSTGSIVIGVWSFLLTQALFVLIPRCFGHEPSSGSASTHRAERFDRAYKAAEAALGELMA